MIEIVSLHGEKGGLMNLRNGFLYFVISIALVFLGMCTLPLDPAKNPKYSGIIDENVSNLPSVAPMGTVYNCTLSIRYPSLIDSFTIQKRTNDMTFVIASGDSVGDTLLFTIDFLQPDDYTLIVILYKTEYTDTLQKRMSVFSTVPASQFSSTRYTMHSGENISFPFTLSDPDSNLLEYYIHRNGIITDTIDVKVANRAALEGTIVSDSGVKLQKVNIYSVEAMDVDSQFSKSAICTVTVADTVFPKVSMVQSLIDSKLTVATLPCTVGVIISDNWYIDSVKVSGLHWNLPEKDTLWIVKTFLDTGLTKDSIEAWDRGANRTAFRYVMEYHGVVQYPPQLKPVTIAPIFEHEKFDTLYLDSYVVITDTSAKYTKDSLTWTITVDSADSMIKHIFDPVKRTLYVRVPDTEIGVGRYTSLTIKVTDPKGLSDILHRVSFWVLEKNDAPVIKIKNQVKQFNAAFDTLTLDSCGLDSDPLDRITWKIEAGKYFKPDSIYSTFRLVTLKSTATIKNPLRYFTGRVAIIPDTTKFKPSMIPIGTLELTDSLRFTVTDGELTTEKYVRFVWNRFQIIKTE
jgi:hypothetical protein